MGTIADQLGHSVYVDTNIVIYAIEGFEKYKTLLLGLLMAMDRQELTTITSELTIAEVLVKPKQQNNTALQEAYLNFLQPSSCLSILPVSRQVLIEAAEIRARSGLRLPDAIHAATAIQSGCKSFLTNDLRFLQIPALRAQVLDSLSSC